MASEVECCLYCGRDTCDPSKICDRCVYGEDGVDHHGGGEDDGFLEDYYGEESGPDSVCEDHHGLDALPDGSRMMNSGKRRGRLGEPIR